MWSVGYIQDVTGKRSTTNPAISVKPLYIFFMKLPVVIQHIFTYTKCTNNSIKFTLLTYN